MKALLAVAVLAMLLNGCALAGLAVLAPGAADTATTENPSEGGVFTQNVWDPACAGAGGTVEPSEGTSGPHNCWIGAY